MRSRLRSLRTAGGGRALPRPLLAVVLAITAGIAALAPLAALVSSGRIPAAALLGDPTELSGVPWFVGAVSTITSHVWSAGAVLYLVAGVAARGSGRPRMGAALLWLAALTAALVTDDQFLVHEVILPWLLGVPEEVTFAVYGVALGTVLWRYHDVVLPPSGAGLLLLGVAALGTAVFIDVLGGQWPLRAPVEEVSKLLGVTAWSAYPAAQVLAWLRPSAPPGRI